MAVERARGKERTLPAQAWVKRTESKNDETLFSFFFFSRWHLPSEWHQFNRAAQPNWCGVIAGAAESGRVMEKNKRENRGGWKETERAWMTVKRKRETAWAEQFPPDIVSPVIGQKRKTWVMLPRSTSLPQFMFQRGKSSRKDTHKSDLVLVFPSFLSLSAPL